MIVAGCQFSIIPMDVDGNIAKTLNCLEKAVHDHKADLVVFPETITTGLTLLSKANQSETIASLWEAVSDIPGRVTVALQEAAARRGVHVVWGGSEKDVVYNSAMVIDDKGEICSKINDKTHPFPTERKDGEVGRPLGKIPLWWTRSWDG